MDQHRIARIARRQKGVFTRAQARACGYSAAQIRHRLATGAWTCVVRDVLAAADLRLDPELRDRAAQLAVADSVLGGVSAARLWKIDLPWTRPHLLVATRVRPLPGAKIEQVTLARREVTRVEGVPSTTLPRTIFDCLRVLPEPQARDLLDRALLRGWVTFQEVVALMQAWAGRHGSVKVRLLVGASGDGSRSAAERRAIALLRRAGIEGWRANVAIRDGQGVIGIGDVVFEAERLVLELDGWAFHTTPEAFQRDRTRQNRLINAGWTVLRFTWRDLVERPDYVIRTIRQALARA